jgi:hypothetical protein
VTAIRPCEREDVPAVASLYEQVARSGSRTPAPGLAAYFERTLFDHPWFDPEIPSLVYVDDDGRIAGFLGSSVRRLLFRGQPIRMGVTGQLVTDPGVRSRAAGMFLLREYLAGPQDLTVTDTASDLVRRLWERLGGDTFHLACVGWVRVFRPLRFAGEYAAHRERRALAQTARGLARAVDPLARKALWRASEHGAPQARTEALTPAALVEHLPEITRGLELYPAYDEPFATWLLRELAAVEHHGSLVAHLVRSEQGDVLGWYVYYRKAGGIGSVLQVATRAETAGAVLDALFHDATTTGAAGLQGRVEGPLRAALARAGTLFHPSGYLALVHGRDPALLHAVHAGHALLTRMEGEWWMGHHVIATADESS